MLWKVHKTYLRPHEITCIRFMALASMYGEFSEMAWDERFELEYVCWAEEIGINPFRIGKLVESNFNRNGVGSTLL